MQQSIHELALSNSGDLNYLKLKAHMQAYQNNVKIRMHGKVIQSTYLATTIVGFRINCLKLRTLNNVLRWMLTYYISRSA